MAWLTEAEFNYRMDVASGRYRRKPKPKPITVKDIDRFFAEVSRGMEAINRRAEPIIRELVEAEKRLAASPLMQGFEAFMEQYAGIPATRY